MLLALFVIHSKYTNLCLVTLNIMLFEALPCEVHFVVLDFYRRPRQIPARSWLLGVNNENTSTEKAVSNQTKQHMGIFLAITSSIMAMWLSWPTQKAISISCRIYLFQATETAWVYIGTIHARETSSRYGRLISWKNLIKAFIILGAVNSIPTNLLMRMIPTQCSLIVPWSLKVA